MSKSQIIIASFIAVSLGLLAISHGYADAIATVALSVLFGAVTLTERKHLDEFEHLKNQLKDLRGKVENILISKGFR